MHLRCLRYVLAPELPFLGRGCDKVVNLRTVLRRVDQIERIFIDRIVPDQNCGYPDDGTEDCIRLIRLIDKLEGVLLVLTMKKENRVVEKNDMQIDGFGFGDNAPLKRSLVDEPTLCDVEVLELLDRWVFELVEGRAIDHALNLG